ncbi:MAG: LacI family DNA-binding transcriptional regulator [Flavobacteriaceae bacterium]
MSKQKKTTIKDIANVLNITPSAVSKALNNHPRISQKTRDAVIQVAKNLNYQPNRLASALRKGKSNLVGVIIPRTNSIFFSNVVQHMEEVLNLSGYNVIMTQSNESYTKECTNIEALLDTQVDGIIASLANETKNFESYNKIINNGVPLVMFDRSDYEIDADYIGIDDVRSSQLIVNHLITQGCKRIAHIAGYSHTRIYKNRIKGYIDSLEQHQMEINEELILESNLSLNDGREKMQQLLQLEERPDAVYAAGDYAALGALQILKEHNIKVPEEIAVVGFSNEPFTALTSPSITTINQHSEQIGKLAAKAFIQRMDEQNSDSNVTNIILEPELIIRESSKRI